MTVADGSCGAEADIGVKVLGDEDVARELDGCSGVEAWIKVLDVDATGYGSQREFGEVKKFAIEDFEIGCFPLSFLDSIFDDDVYARVCVCRRARVIKRNGRVKVR